MSHPEQGKVAIVIEKPFGNDLASARQPLELGEDESSQGLVLGRFRKRQMVLVGHRPRLQFETTPYPLLSLDRTEALYGRGRFVFVTLAPAVLLTAALVVGVAAGPYAGWLIVPAAFHLTASKMDIAYSLVALRQPAGTQCRIGEGGLEFTEPVDYEVP